MKKVLTLALLSGLLFIGTDSKAQDKKPPASPAVSVSESTASGVDIKIDYGQPSVRGREIGKDVEPMAGKVWRTGANKATVFEVSKNVTVNGKSLAAGKYGLFTIWNGDSWTVIFNKTWDQWGAYDYKEGDDVVRIDVPNAKPSSPSEKMTFWIGKDGKVTLAWGGVGFDFTVK